MRHVCEIHTHIRECRRWFSVQRSHRGVAGTITLGYQVSRPNRRQSLTDAPACSPAPTELGSATTATRTIRTIVLEQGFEGARLNTGTMSNLQILAATILANFTTVRIPRCENLWISAVPNPQPKHLRGRLRSRALTRETFSTSCHRQHLEHRLLEQGHRTFFARIEGGGPGWRLLFFCRDAEDVRVSYDVGVGACGPGYAVTFDAEQFVMHRLGLLERIGRLEMSYGWWDWEP